MKHAVAHDLGADKAARAAKAAFAAYEQKYAKYSPRANWLSDRRADISFSAKGVSIKGTIEVGATSIDMDLDVPFLLRPFKGKALEVIEREIRVWIEKARSGEI